MNWMELLRKEIEYTYKVTEDLMDLVEDDKLEWKPPKSTTSPNQKSQKKRKSW